MNNVFLLLSILAIFKLTVEEGQRSSTLVRAGHALLYVLFLFFVHDYALNVSKLTIDKVFNTPLRLRDVSLVVMADLILSALAATSSESRWPTKRRWRMSGPLETVGGFFHKLTYFVPPILAFPALFYLRVELLYTMTGVNFWLMTGVMMGIVVLLVMLGPWICKMLDFGSDAVITLSLFAFGTIVLAAVLAPESAVYARVVSDTLSQVIQGALVILLIACAALIGWLLFRVRTKKEIRRSRE